jgi:oligo-1,6-glucosidase
MAQDGAMAWWHSAVAYQIYPRSFADSNGDGIGDLRGIINHVDHLVELGVDVVWLSPVYRSPMDDNGYDISDYYDVDPSLGTLSDLDELIALLHSRGLKVVMDVVINHTSDEHPWFGESRDPASPKRDWYIWRPARAGTEPGTVGAEPTNAGSAFSGSGWAYDPHSGEYYLHIFSAKQPDLNWENPQVRAELYTMMRWWVDRGVDGFRLDVINVISKTYPLTDGPAGPDGLCYDFTMVANGPRLHEYLTEMNAEVGFAEKDLFIVGETPGINAELARSFTDPQARQLNMVFTFEHVEVDQAGLKWELVPLKLSVMKATLAEYQYGLEQTGWNSLYFENHDQPRSVSRFGDDSPALRQASAKTLATTLHLLKGTPYVYQGQELGMTNAGFTTIDQYNDLESINFYHRAVALGMPSELLLAPISAKSRDNARTPMCWDASASAGFTTGTPWLAVNANHTEINAAAEIADPGSVFHHYRKLIALRHGLEVVREGRFDLLLAADESLFCFTRTWGAEQVLVVANWSSVPVDWPSGLPQVAGAELLLGTHPSGALALAAWESRVYRLS